MEWWDVEAADTALIQLLQVATKKQIYHYLFHYCARDFRSIGHKVIALSNCYVASQVTQLVARLVTLLDMSTILNPYF